MQTFKVELLGMVSRHTGSCDGWAMSTIWPLQLSRSNLVRELVGMHFDLVGMLSRGVGDFPSNSVLFSLRWPCDRGLT